MFVWKKPNCIKIKPQKNSVISSKMFPFKFAQNKTYKCAP